MPHSVKDEFDDIPNNHHSSQGSQSSQKENAPPEVRPIMPPSSPRPADLSSSANYSTIPDSQPSNISAPTGTLPPQLLAMLSSIISTLQTSFSSAPPHTIQRLAELVLRPAEHYRTLPSYLRAIDRVISVSSSVKTYHPLAFTNTSPEADGSRSGFLGSGGSSNDDFNGAALTRIPWLRDENLMLTDTERPLAGDLRTESTSLIDGPNGAGSIETVTVSMNGMANASNQNGALRREPDSTVASTRMTRSSTINSRSDDEADEELVHARGPDMIGEVDTGPQSTDRVPGGFDIEAALGRKGEGEMMIPTHHEEDKGDKDADGDVVISDIDGVGKEGEKEVMSDTKE